MASVPKGDESKDIAMVIVVVAVVAIVCIGALLAMPRTSDESGNDQEDSVLVVMTITSARWEELDASGLSASTGCLCLWLSVNITNNWAEELAVNSMYLKLQTTSGAIYSVESIWGPDSLAVGGAGTFGMVFEVPENLTPQKLVYDGIWDDITFSADMPVPSALVPDVVMAVTSATYRTYDLNGITIWSSDTQFLWLTFTITNQWMEPIDTDSLSFDVLASNGTSEYCWQMEGPEEVAAGGTATITANFYMDVDFVPVSLTFSMLFGPSASAVVPPVSSSG